MSKVLLAILVSTAILTSFAYAQLVGQATRFELQRVHTVEDSSACAHVGGRAALVADLDTNGDLASAWEAYCLIPSK